ncbi:MAG: SDR family oxidoreductase [Gammaproteobacteria bacterium]|nr:SDR family oxidoreductase [Gammaproteobacteria bacterium]
MDLRLDGRTCLVTGASAGIGVAIARGLAAEGARLALCARREARLQAVADSIAEQTGERPIVVPADLMQADAPARIRDRLDAAFGGLDILVNNAGLSSRPQTIAPDEVWNAGFDLKFTTLRRLTNALLPGMRERGWGRIVNITGIVEPISTSAALTACAAVHAWSKGLSRDLAADGITVNCVPPGRIDSEQIQRIFSDPEVRRRQIEQHIPKGRFGAPEELADLVVFLCSPRADYITGTVIPVDGGMSRFSM